MGILEVSELGSSRVHLIWECEGNAAMLYLSPANGDGFAVSERAQCRHVLLQGIEVIYDPC